MNDTKRQNLLDLPRRWDSEPYRIILAACWKVREQPCGARHADLDCCTECVTFPRRGMPVPDLNFYLTRRT